MAIPGSPPVSLSDIASEYSDSAPYSLSDFLGENGAPGSFPASMSDWYGLSAIEFVLAPGTTHTAISPYDAQVQITSSDTVNWNYSTISDTATGDSVSVSTGTDGTVILFNVTGFGSHSWDVEAQEAGGGAVIDSWTITVTVDI